MAFNVYSWSVFLSLTLYLGTPFKWGFHITSYLEWFGFKGTIDFGVQYYKTFCVETDGTLAFCAVRRLQFVLCVWCGANSSIKIRNLKRWKLPTVRGVLLQHWSLLEKMTIHGAIGGRITVRLVFSLARLDLPKKEHVLLLV